jgi:hypothetical protein
LVIAFVKLCFSREHFGSYYQTSSIHSDEDFYHHQVLFCSIFTLSASKSAILYLIMKMEVANLLCFSNDHRQSPSCTEHARTITAIIAERYNGRVN